MNGRWGFTLIEVFIATIILGVLLAATMGPLGNLFQMTRSSQQQLDNSVLAQQTTERIYNAWQNVARFDQSCIDLSSAPLPAGISVTVQPLSPDAVPIGSATPIADCPAVNAPAPIKRVYVIASGGGPRAEVVIDISRPGGGP